ncbi:hypothetical protein [Myroides odoratus]|uniref:hypothetical protein n=1 Tax=Myroides odoratus TaxID=256 RepID=UPI00333E6C38
MTIRYLEIGRNLFGRSSVATKIGIQSIDDILMNPEMLTGRSLKEVQKAIGGTKGWQATEMLRICSLDKGWVFRELGGKGEYSGKNIQYHPGTHRHFKGEPYWKVSNGDGTSKVKRIPAGK